MANRNVCEVILDVLADAGVEHVFGIPGDAINDLVEAIRRQDRIAFIQVRHEETGAFAAGAQAKLTGRLAVCVGTAGPGAVHLLNGLYDAKLDHAPVLAITGQVDTALAGTDYHQEVDLYTLFKDVAVYNQRITNAAQLPGLAVRACQEALAHRGVAHIAIPSDIAAQSVPEPELRAPVLRHCGETVPCGDDLDRAAKVINDHSKIVILAGIGARGARRELLSISEKLAAPIVRTLRAKDVVPDNHALSLGGLGQLGTRPAVDAMDDCDALMMVGTDFPYRDFFPNGRPAVQIDIEPTRIGKRYPVSVGLAGDAKRTLVGLMERVEAKKDRNFLKVSQAKMEKWRARMAAESENREMPIRPQALAAAVGRAARDDSIFICDTGAVTVWAARHLEIRDDQRFTLSSALASMAFGLPGAIGAQLAYPERQVIALVGDGGFSMLMADFLTAVKYDLPVKIVVFNNHKLGLIQMEQEASGYPEFQTQLHNPDFAQFAVLCGGEGRKVTGPDELTSALEQSFKAEGPAVVDVEVNPEELTMPPKVRVNEAIGFGLAKAREFIDLKGR